MQGSHAQDRTATMGEVKPCAHQACNPDALFIPYPDPRPRPLAVLNLILLELELLQNLISQEPPEVRVGLGEVPRIQV